MTRLLSVLLAATFATFAAPAFPADAPPAAAKVEPKPADASSQIVTPENQAATLKGIIAKMKSDAKAKNEKPTEARK